MKATRTAALREPGFWLVVLLVAAQALNALRVALDGSAFATYFGVPLAAPEDARWVAVYGLRTTFIALFAAYLLWRRQVAALSAFALLAVMLPIGDLLLVVDAGAPTATVMRHAAIGVLLLITWGVLARWASRIGGPGPR